jgi:KDO2-lipid IV(A) lauroyltransferase
METTRPSFAPANWPGWIAAGVIWVLGHLPYRIGIGLAATLGPLMRLLMKKRVHVVRRNIERCFPELNKQQQQQLLRRNFRSAAVSVAEFAYAWTGSKKMAASLVDIEGVEHLERAGANGRGVLLLTCHMSCLEMSGWLAEPYIDAKRLAAIYRPLGSEVIEWLQNRGRSRYAAGMYAKADIRGAIKHLRQGGFLWYAPDQDFGPRQTEFLPFFGIQTATLVATQKLARLGNAEVVPFLVRRDESRGKYIIRIGPTLKGIPSANVLADLREFNRVTEEWIRTAPEQYWWLHRRFKTRPEREAPFYD